MSSETEILLVIDAKEDYTAVKQAEDAAPEVNATAVQQPNDELELESQVEPITAVLIGGAVLLVAKFLVDWWDRRRGGLIIDRADSGDRRVRRSADVPYGYVIVFPESGDEVEIQVKDAPKDATERLLASILESGFKTTQQVAKLAGELVSGEKN